MHSKKFQLLKTARVTHQFGDSAKPRQFTSTWQMIRSACVRVSVCLWKPQTLTCGHVEVGSGSGWCCSVWRPVWGWSCTRPPWWSLCHEPSFRRLDMRRRSFTRIQQRAVQQSSFRAAQEAQKSPSSGSRGGGGGGDGWQQQGPGRPTQTRHAAVCTERDTHISCFKPAPPDRHVRAASLTSRN